MNTLLVIFNAIFPSYLCYFSVSSVWCLKLVVYQTRKPIEFHIVLWNNRISSLHLVYSSGLQWNKHQHISRYFYNTAYRLLNLKIPMQTVFLLQVLNITVRIMYLRNFTKTYCWHDDNPFKAQSTIKIIPIRMNPK